jgi:hypothetical protein
MCIIIDESGTVVFEDKAPPDPGALARLIRKRAPAVARVGFERDAMASWLWYELKQLDPSVVCVDARHAQGLRDNVTTARIVMAVATSIASACIAGAISAMIGGTTVRAQEVSASLSPAALKRNLARISFSRTHVLSESQEFVQKRGRRSREEHRRMQHSHVVQGTVFETEF